ncbi:MAG: anaerobic ribonucleoside-triphosphate reductase activating protein [Acidobacteria bacterium]|nr:MAG: anaerobic ribonucleoside-triphosphate reductase activating protein [Acidobacteriota bacterium]
MRIAGLEPCSFCDYPGKLAAVVFTQGCNLRCPFCHNAELIPTAGKDRLPLSEAQVLNFLQTRRGRLDAVVVSGGEPTLQANLAEFIAAVRELGYLTKLDTNGTNPRMLESLLNSGVLDYVAMDIKAPWDKYDELSGTRVPAHEIQRSIELILESGVAHEFRTTFVPHLLREADLAAIKSLLPESSVWKRQTFRPMQGFREG